jgi:transcriptional regulator with XRE-family HTH domain
MGFKDNLKAELDYQGMQLKELSAKCGVSKNTLGNYLTGHNSLPSIETGVKIAQALGVSAEYLVNGESDEEESVSSLPVKYREIVESLYTLDDGDLSAVHALVSSLQKRYPVKKLTKDVFLKKLNDIFIEQTRLGHPEVTIKAGDLHKLVGGYPGPNHRMPICCSLMRDVFQDLKDIIIHSPTSGIGATLEISYSLPI